MQECSKMTVESCRKLLGSSGDSMSDGQIERLRDQLFTVANVFFDHMQGREKEEIFMVSYVQNATQEELDQLAMEEAAIDDWDDFEGWDGSTIH